MSNRQLHIVRASNDQAFEFWLRGALSRLHDDVLREKLPDELLLVIEAGQQEPARESDERP